MHRTARIATAAPNLVQATAAAILAILIVYCLLPFDAIDNNYSTDLETGAPRNAFDRRGVAPVDFLTLSRREVAEIWRGSFNSAALPDELPADFSLPRLSLTFQSIGFEMVASRPAVFSVDRHAKSYEMKSNVTSKTTRGYSGPRRHPETGVDRIVFETPALAPMAFMRFCLKYPKDCEIRRMPFRPRPVALTARRMDELASVNRAVNFAIRPKANNNGVMREEWSVSPLEGDCNDFAVTKRHQLLARGWPSHTLLLAEVVIPSGEHHLVLIVRTREGDLVLDNLNSNVRPISQVHYQWVRGQQEKNPKFWSTINVPPAAQVAINTH